MDLRGPYRSCPGRRPGGPRPGQRPHRKHLHRRDRGEQRRRTPRPYRRRGRLHVGASSRRPGGQVSCAGLHRRAFPPGEHLPPRRPVRQGRCAQGHAGGRHGPPRGDQRVGAGWYAVHHGLRPQGARGPVFHGSALRAGHRHGDLRRDPGTRRTSRRPFAGRASLAWES